MLLLSLQQSSEIFEDICSEARQGTRFQLDYIINVGKWLVTQFGPLLGYLEQELSGYRDLSAMGIGLRFRLYPFLEWLVERGAHESFVSDINLNTTCRFVPKKT